jgi:hypothetical protein
MSGKKWTRTMPDAVIAHEQVVILARPSSCPHCDANAAWFTDDRQGHLNCGCCGWELLYLRRGQVPDGPGPRGRGRANA